MFQHDASRDTTLHRRLQDGIYFRSKEGPARSYALVLLNVRGGTTAVEARAAIARVWEMLQALREGIVMDLQPSRAGEAGASREDGNLTCLIGFGARLFEAGRNLTSGGRRPERLVGLSARRHGPFFRLRWVEGEGRPDDADLAIQLIGDTEFAVARAVMEIYRLLRQGTLPLDFLASHGGFNRPDKRSWLNFHDGLSNIRVEDRAAAIEVQVKNPPRDPDWMVGGTYMVFLRLALDLEAWWSLSRDAQELAVGRDKLSGCPLVGNAGSVPRTDPRCPVTPGHPDVDPPSTTQLVRLSHIHRVNPTRAAPTREGANRIFRQGYEFLESLPGGRPRPGLNFVSFQCDLAHFTHILETPGWLNTVNFGGPDDSRPLELAWILAGGYYAVPPKGDPKSFPGAEVFLGGGAKA